MLDLPTAQHKAGLAGLLLHLRSLEERDIEGRPEIDEIEPLSASIRVSQKSLQVLFDDLFAAAYERKEVKEKYKDQTPLDEIVVTVERGGKEFKEKRFVYEELRPTGHVLAHWLKDGKESSWHALWRNMLWSVLRAQDRTRIEYIARVDAQPVSFVGKLWASLVKVEKQRAKGGFVTSSIAGSVLIGAQAKNAEQIAFVGRVEQNLLLYFWQWAAPLFVPRAIELRTKEWKDSGYLIVIPEVADLVDFLEDMEHFWRDRDPARTGYRPTESLIDLPEEGGLEFLHQLTKRRIEQAGFLRSIHALELYHQEKKGNNVRQHAAERLLPDQRMLRSYEEIRGDRRQHPLFKRLLISNLVRGDPWFHGAEILFERYPLEYFIHRPETPRGRFFGTDARARFKMTITDLEKRENHMQPIPTDEALQRLIFRLIRNYVDKRTRDRGGISDKKFEELAETEKKKYRDTKPKVASTAFLALRGRREQDIAEYVTGTLASVGFYQSEDDFLLLSEQLIHDPDKVKNLAMLALSAHSWVGREQNEGAEPQPTANA
ncbi:MULTISPECIES: type I-MYXAN CRISPR-associated protein Cmx8 [Thiorhodovibrio]|uniref:type I-MYXAN CRISPR-associated protein Cmx8 n=1 Tax=Thiorhodovibrio TaxID=61593 RepID=UPI0019148D72|nr:MULTISPECIES: type I-MYXAN CRISPR-associated protein Cmx8 [Thiorhodovibrio]